MKTRTKILEATKNLMQLPIKIKDKKLLILKTLRLEFQRTN